MNLFEITSDCGVERARCSSGELGCLTPISEATSLIKKTGAALGVVESTGICEWPADDVNVVCRAGSTGLLASEIWSNLATTSLTVLSSRLSLK
jgi:hypothetical protein